MNLSAMFSSMTIMGDFQVESGFQLFQRKSDERDVLFTQYNQLYSELIKDQPNNKILHKFIAWFAHNTIFGSGHEFAHRYYDWSDTYFSSISESEELATFIRNFLIKQDWPDECLKVFVMHGNENRNSVAVHLVLPDK